MYVQKQSPNKDYSSQIKLCPLSEPILLHPTPPGDQIGPTVQRLVPFSKLPGHDAMVCHDIRWLPQVGSSFHDAAE